MIDYNVDVLDKLDSGVYKNSKILNIGGIPITVKDLFIKVPLIAGLNFYLIGGAGEGKSQYAYDLQSFLGEGYCYAEGRPDFEPSELLKQVRLDKIKDVKTDKELVELTENVNKALFYVEELNRCPALVQNYFLNFGDGKFAHGGNLIPLGRNGYSLLIATGNIGNGAYVGVTDSDRALKDRMHMIVKQDYPDFLTTPLDDLKIFSGKKNPRATLCEKKENYLDEIIKLHKEFEKREVPFILPLLGVYFNKGLDFLENTEKQSKRAVAEKWPNVKGIRKDTDEALITPLSKRAVFGAIGFSQAVEMIAESKGQEIKNSVSVFLDCLKFTVPYSGVLAGNFVYNECDGDVYLAFDKVMEKNREQINDKIPKLEEALLLAETGKKDKLLLDDIASKTEGKWLPVRQAISDYADELKENPSNKGKKLKDILKEAKD